MTTYPISTDKLQPWHHYKRPFVKDLAFALACPDVLKHSIVNNGAATFVDFRLSDLSVENILAGKYKPSRDLSPYAKQRPPIASTSLVDHDPPATVADKAILAYRAAPKRLSDFGLFQGNGATQQYGLLKHHRLAVPGGFAAVPAVPLNVACLWLDQFAPWYVIFPVAISRNLTKAAPISPSPSAIVSIW